jgi:hypothetical protein
MPVVSGSDSNYGIFTAGGAFDIPVSLIRVVHLDVRTSPRIFVKNRNDPNVISRGLEEDNS